MFRSVLVPVDFTQDAECLLEFCQGLTGLGVEKAVLAHVVDASGMEGPVIAAKVDNVRTKVNRSAVVLKDAGLEVEVRITTGEAAREIVLLAAQTQADAIVMGSHGKRILDEILVGSVSDRVLGDSDVPVLLARFDLVRNSDAPGAMLPEFPRKMLVPTDFSAHADRALGVALDIAEAVPICGIDRNEPCGILLLHVIDRSVGEHGIVDAELEADEELAKRVALGAERGVNVIPLTAIGDVQRVIIDQVHDRRATGVVLGSRGANLFAEAFVGSTFRTVRRASCPVIAVP
jgi:nucleotide-binding universal stress UspA family protein